MYNCFKNPQINSVCNWLKLCLCIPRSLKITFSLFLMYEHVCTCMCLLGLKEIALYGHQRQQSRWSTHYGSCGKKLRKTSKLDL